MSKTEENEFEQLITDLKTDVEEEDLNKLLDARLDMYKNLFFWILGAFLTVIMLFQNLEPISPSSSLFPIWIISFGISVVSFGWLVYSFFRKRPSHRQQIIISDYIKARKRLRDLK